MKNLVILVLIVIAFYAGCKKDDSFISSSSLIGKWSWFITCGGFAGCVTPEVEHVTINLVFTADSIYNYYANDTLRASYRFSVYKSVSTDCKDTTNIIKYGLNNESFSITHDTLSMGNAIASSAYKRIK